jgi:ATP-dependent DNA helicase 2 subunit 1
MTRWEIRRFATRSFDLNTYARYSKVTLKSEQGREVRKASCLKSVGDCKEGQIRVAVVPLAVNDDKVLPGSTTDMLAGEAFYIGRFYEELSNAAHLPFESFADSEDDGDKKDIASQLIDRRITNLEQEVLGVLNPRSMASINWIISNSPRVEMAVKQYALTMEAKIKSHVWLDQRNNKRVKVMTQRSSKDTGELLLESQIEKYYPYGRTEVVITDEEMKQVKSMDMEKGIHLLGFKPRSSLRCEDNLRAPYFIYPDEKALVGSIMTFTAFWKSMIDLDRIAICAMRSRSNVAPRLVALVPAKERRSDDGRRILTPDGMHVVNLPFSDDIRAIPAHPVVENVPEEAIEAAEKIMDHFQLCGCRDFENPQLFRHFKHLEAISLEEKVEEEELIAVEQCIIPDSEEFSSDEVKQMFEDFKNAIDPDYDSKVMQGGGKAGAGSAKRKREPKAEPGPADANLVDIVNNGGLEKLTVDKLKEHCRSLGLTVGGKKADLIQRILDKVKKD